ncbi:MarC family protein [Cognatiyoonia sp. IB215446]|uniref:MarC family protein n=1 Tax=Cognatiyoonia sp. IB215446 TaxID=3097355 RepID=UPI002A11D43D|nr:MarC family protein [Cognatiyoonia sp. IB215446]MDX8349778.1 MarC family protein [Cognatiyoonia sp. IB215446]
MTELPALIAAFTTMFIIIDPPGLAPVFIALTQGMSAAQRRAIAVRACVVSAVLMVLFLFLGETVLGFIGISMDAFRIAGGVLLFLTALDMLFQKRQARREESAAEGQAEHHDDPSVFPLALPLIVGPGAITTIILLAGEAQRAVDFGAIAGVLLAVLFIVFMAFLAAPSIERALGKTGLNIVTRVLGMLLAALAVQFVLDGLRGFGIGG